MSAQPPKAPSPHRGPRPWCVVLVSEDRIISRLQSEAAALESARRLTRQMRELGSHDTFKVVYRPVAPAPIINTMKCTPRTEWGKA